MEGKPFSVIKFLSDNSIDYVPTKWIIIDEEGATVKFPKLKNSKSAKLQNDPKSDPKSVWPEWNVKVKKSYNTAEEAEQKAQQYSHSSDIESSSQDTTSRFKKRKTESRQPTIPEPTTTIFNLTSSTESSHPMTSDQVNHPTPETPVVRSGLPVVTSIPTISQPLPFLFEVQQSTGSSPELDVPMVLESLPQPSTSSGGTLHYFNTQPANNTWEVLLRETRAFQEKSLLNDAIIIQEQQQIKQYLLKLTTSAKTNDSTQEGPYSFIPLRSAGTLHELNDKLQGTEKFNDFVAALTRFGRTEVSKSIEDMLSYLFEPQFSRAVRYTGASGKLPLKDTTLVKAVREAAIRVHPEAKVKQINQAIAIWFRGSGDRGGGRIRRNGNQKGNKKTGTEISANSIEGNTTAESEADPSRGSGGNDAASSTDGI